MALLASWRRVYQCDCDGVSHLDGHESYSAAREELGVRRHLDVIQRVTGTRPKSCPWRAFYHPLVREVLQTLSWSFDSGNLAAVLEADPPGILLEALGVYRRALESTRADDEKLRRLKDEQRRKGAPR